MATTTEKTTKPEAREKLTLQQKFVKLREEVPRISKKKHSDGVSYKYVQIYEVYEYITPAMNSLGINFDIVGEKATRHGENGDDIYYSSYVQQTRSGSQIVWVYESDIVFRWTNADDPDDKMEITVHAIGTNTGGPDKAKGSALTYCIKYLLFTKFSIDQGDDPDDTDHSSYAPPAPYNGRQNAPRPQGSVNGQPRQQNAENGTQNAQRSAGLSEAQLNRLYAKAEACGMSKNTTNKRIKDKYNQDNPAALTREQYDEICASLDASAAKKKEEQQNAE